LKLPACKGFIAPLTKILAIAARRKSTTASIGVPRTVAARIILGVENAEVTIRDGNEGVESWRTSVSVGLDRERLVLPAQRERRALG
jgi:hypothetical protein